MRLLLAAAALCASCFTAPARSEQGFVVVMPGQDIRANGRGLECRQTAGLLPAYAAPSTAAAVVGRVQGMVAATGPARDGFVPVALDDGRRVWLRAKDTWPNSRHKTCYIARGRDGHLRASRFNAIQSD